MKTEVEKHRETPKAFYDFGSRIGAGTKWFTLYPWLRFLFLPLDPNSAPRRNRGASLFPTVIRGAALHILCSHRFVGADVQGRGKERQEAELASQVCAHPQIHPHTRVQV